ncbi:MAG: flavodoxin domain-containing protein [Oscillibacter sp.]|nr:flavodoxin domain-containing protein [Oscillibacter sp.]
MEKNERPQLTADLEGNYLIDKVSAGEKAIGLFYAPSGGSVHKVAKRIKQKIKDRKVDMLYIRDVKPEDFLNYRNLILVSSTSGKDAWNNKETDEWATFMPGLQKLHLDGRRVALVGLGNCALYPNNFADGLRNLAELVEEKGGILIGKTEPDDYTFTLSRALQDNLFVGLPLDEDNEADKTDARIEKWLSLVLSEMEE